MNYPSDSIIFRFSSSNLLYLVFKFVVMTKA